MHRTFTAAWVALAVSICLRPGVAAQEPYTLDDVSFLTGCWAGTMGTLDLLEQWTEADGGVMLGTTRFVRNGAVVDWEFGRIVEEQGGVTLWPYPQGVISEHGFPLVTTGDEYVFENLLHDFPVRIIYAVRGPESLRPRIEGRDGASRGWTLERTPCPG